MGHYVPVVATISTGRKDLGAAPPVAAANQCRPAILVLSFLPWLDCPDTDDSPGSCLWLSRWAIPEP